MPFYRLIINGIDPTSVDHGFVTMRSFFAPNPSSARVKAIRAVLWEVRRRNFVEIWKSPQPIVSVKTCWRINASQHNPRKNEVFHFFGRRSVA